MISNITPETIRGKEKQRGEAALSGSNMPVSIPQDSVDKIRALIYKETGMFIEANKDYLIKARLENRMTAICSESFQEYYHNLLFGATNEIGNFIEAMTINETYFFRDYPQLQGFADIVLPDYLEEKSRIGSRSLRIWSAACSNGCEPYTLAIILQEVIDNFNEWDVRIDANDIDRKVLQHARIGLYDEREVKDIPSAYKSKYFTETSNGWKIRPTAARYVNFEHMNLIDNMSMRKKRDYDFILCRNVLIYFDDDSRRKVVNMFYDALAPGGYLFLGSSESVGRISAAFTLERRSGFLSYRKPARK